MDPASPELIALLAACRARPADDLPRLVLADWLDENGDPDRAEFVRVQVELSHPTADAKRMRELKERVEKILSTHQQNWAAGYRAAHQAMYPPRIGGLRGRNSGPIPPWYRYDRGLFHLANAADFVNRPEFRSWLQSPELPWVEQIDLGYTSPEGFVKADLPDELHGRIGLTFHLAMTDPFSWRQQFRLLAVSSNFTAVRSLTVSGADGPAVWEEITRADVSQLVGVSVTGSWGAGVSGGGFVASSPFTSLSALDLGTVSEPDLRAIAASPYLGNLTHINVTGSQIGDAGMVALCRSRLAETLRRVEFANTGITDVGVAALARSPLFAHMNGPRLNLMMNRIGDAGLTALAQSEHLLRFSELVLRENYDKDTPGSGIGDAGVEALAESPYSANLRYLDFWRNRITDRGAFALARSPHLNSVVDLSVKENVVTAAGAAALHARFGEAAKV